MVVDHGTTSDTKQSLEREYPEVVRIVGTPELWWTGATNLGIRYALSCGAELVMLLNNDCYVAPDATSELIELWQQSGESAKSFVAHHGIALSKFLYWRKKRRS